MGEEGETLLCQIWDTHVSRDICLVAGSPVELFRLWYKISNPIPFLTIGTTPTRFLLYADLFLRCQQSTYLEVGGILGACQKEDTHVSYHILFGGRVCTSFTSKGVTQIFFGIKGRYRGDLHTGQYQGPPLLVGGRGEDSTEIVFWACCLHRQLSLFLAFPPFDVQDWTWVERDAMPRATKTK